jgi:mitogen-activated protein kinase kinase kinase
MSFAPPPGSRFSVSTMDSQRRSSHRTSTASSIPPAVPEKFTHRTTSSNGTEAESMIDPPRVSISGDDGNSVDLESDEDEATKRMSNRESRTSLLPPVNLSFESFSESMSNLTGASTDTTATRLTASRRPMSVASKRMSYVKELRSKRDTSDTGSIMTMDEITAEVESRQGNAAVNTVADDASLSGWTQVTDGDDENETPAAPADVPAEGAEEEEDEDEFEMEEEEEYDEEYDEDEEEFDEDEEKDETGNAIESNGMHIFSLARRNVLLLNDDLIPCLRSQVD